MILYKKSEKRDYKKIAEQLYKGSRLTDSHIPHGFSSIVLFEFGDIYIDESINAILNADIKYDIDYCLLQFSKDNYGIITEEEKDYNIENKYLGNGKNLIGRYKITIGIIEIKVLKDYTIIVLKNR